MNGKGKYKWPDGSEYEGEYVNNKREGKGKFKWSTGAIFEGIFHNGKPKGKGKMTYKGSSVNSEFKNGQQDAIEFWRILFEDFSIENYIKSSLYTDNININELYE